jgi:hypothetical protein
LGAFHTVLFDPALQSRRNKTKEFTERRKTARDSQKFSFGAWKTSL